MASLLLAPQLARWLPPEVAGADRLAALDLPGRTVGEVLEALFARHPTLRGYVLDERRHVRHHVAIFVDGCALPRKDALDQALDVDSEVHVLQALSGG